MKSTINLNFKDKLLIICALSLSFTQALTLNIGFPLKLYEFLLFILIIKSIFGFRFKLKYYFKNEFTIVLVLFACLFMSVLANGFALAVAPNNFVFISRFGQLGDSFMKLFYALLVFVGFVLVAGCSSITRIKLIYAWLIGSIFSAVYGWYLMVFSALGRNVLLLPGITEPQYINILVTNPIMRMGTFPEGNFAGLFFFLSAILACYVKRHKTALFLALSTIPTFSTVALATTTFLGFYMLWRLAVSSSKLIRYPIYLFMIIASLGVGFAVYNNPVLNILIIRKLASDNDDPWSVSKKDRIGQSIAGINMFKDNPILGVGLSQYGYSYEQYKDPDSFEYPSEFKRIPNNVYVELLSEGGLLTFVCFLALLLVIFRRLTSAKQFLLRMGLVSTMISFIAFPTFSLMYIWFFLGISSGEASKQIKLQR